MNTRRIRRTVLAATAAAVLPLGLAACGDDGDSDDSGNASQQESQDSGKDNGKGGESDQADSPFGPACGSVPKEGKGSFDGMAQDPVATAAGNNPELSTLVSAVKKADLVDTLNNADDITVFAPTNDAFDKLPEEDLKKVMNDKEELTKILTYHVTEQPLDAEKLADGSHKTMEGGKLSTSGSGESFKVNDEAAIGCGEVETANATVHLIDTVLMPKS